MITPFNRELVYTGFDMAEFAKVRALLNANGVDYVYKVHNRAGHWSFRKTGAFGASDDVPVLSYQYDLFVKKADGDRAGQLLRELKEGK